MAFAITNKALTVSLDAMTVVTGGTSPIVAKVYQEFADQTATTTVTAGGQGDAGAAYRTWRMMLWMKTYVVGTATVGAIFELQTADNAAFTTNIHTVAIVQFANVASATNDAVAFVIGITPLLAGQQFFRIKVTLNGTATTAFDAIVQEA